nr:2-(3-amino-3-carboxypropyl)histidine synthase subunit 2 [Onthophagus taurus]
MEQFSSNAQITLQKTTEIKNNWSKNNKSIPEYYELTTVVDFIAKNSFKTVCLQFPDYMLEDSYEIAQYLNKNLQNDVYIMADSSYESCCVDYITAQHINADAIIHFGPRCSSEWTETIPCLCIYEKDDLNPKELAELIQDDNRNLLNFQLKERIEPLYYFNPKRPEDKIKKYELNRMLLKRRYFLVEKIKDSKRIGIVIATLVIKNFLKAIDRVKKLLKLHKKKCYVINVGKPTVAKLANFPEMDVYVLVCCPSSNIFESRDFYKPIVTLYDVELALNSTEKRFSYEINSDFLDDDFKTTDINNPDVSLISGDVRWRQNEEEVEIGGDKEVVVKDKGTMMLANNSGGEFLSGRSFKGLEQKLGETEVKIAKEGRKGIAQGYKNEMF